MEPDFFPSRFGHLFWSNHHEIHKGQQAFSKNVKNRKMSICICIMICVHMAICQISIWGLPSVNFQHLILGRFIFAGARGQIFAYAAAQLDNRAIIRIHDY